MRAEFRKGAEEVKWGRLYRALIGDRCRVSASASRRAARPNNSFMLKPACPRVLAVQQQETNRC